MSPTPPDDPGRAERFVWRDGDVTVRRAKDKPPLPSQRASSSVSGVLGTLRRDRKLTQAELAKRLGVDQGAISRLERRGDHKLSTLLDYLASLGGEDVDLTVTFADGDRVSLPLARR